MEADDVKNRKEAVIYTLLELNKKNKPVSFGNFFLDSGYSLGIDSFKDMLEEMYQKGWLTKSETPSGHVPGMPYLRTVDIKYGISLNGFNYLVSLGLVEERFKIKDDKNTSSYILIEGNKNQVSVDQSNSVNLKDNQKQIKSSSTKIIIEIIIGLFVIVVGGLILFYLTKN
jgi:hypothetical protein